MRNMVDVQQTSDYKNVGRQTGFFLHTFVVPWPVPFECMLKKKKRKRKATLDCEILKTVSSRMGMMT